MDNGGPFSQHTGYILCSDVPEVVAFYNISYITPTYDCL